MKTRCWSVYFMLALFVATNVVEAKPVVQAEIGRIGDTAHLEFKGQKNWKYEIQRDGGKKVVVTIPAIDDASAVALQGFSDSLVQKVDVNRNGPDGTYQITFHLNGKDIEAFDYLTDEPSRLIVDFYKRTEPEAAPVVASVETPGAPEVPPPSNVAKTGDLPKKQKAKAAKSRKPAGSEVLAVAPVEVLPADVKKSDVALKFGIFDGGDDNYDRFRIKDYEIREDAKVASRHNIYLAFPALKLPVSQLDKVIENAPEYVIRPKDSRENKEARLLLTLFERGRYAVFLHTYNYFVKKYPDSDYNEIIKNVAADIYLQRWRKDGNTTSYELAKALYKELVERYPQSPIRERNSLALNYALLERGEALLALQMMDDFVQRFPRSSEIPQIRKGMAEALISLRKFDEAIEQYKIIKRDFPKSAHAAEVEYRMGDVWFAKGDYSLAIQTYEKTLKELPNLEKVYANLDYNLAEARFWEKDHKRALNQYITFVNNYPTHPHGGYALTRIGELLEIFGVDQRRVMGALLESYFRFPTHPGAAVARMRMLSQQMRGMKAKELKKSLEEVAQIAQTSKLPGVQEFTTLMVADGLQNRGEYISALDQLITYYQKNPGSLNLDAFRSRILRNISNEMKSRVERGEFMAALDFYNKYSNNWLKNSDRIDVPYLVANAYETAGAFDEAHRLYIESLARRKAIVGTEREKERRVQENLPSVDSIQLRIAASALAVRKYMEAYSSLKAIGEGQSLSPKETVEKVELAAQVYEHRNEPTKAKESLVKLATHWKGDPALLSTVYMKLAEISFKSADFKEAEDNANKLLELDTKENLLSQKLVMKAYQIKGDSLVGQQKSLAAAEVYQSMLEKFEEKEPVGMIRFKLGKILFDKGDLKGAREVWQSLAGGNNNFLWLIGEEKLKSANWQDEYTKYTQRIPAMVQDKNKGSQQ